MSTLSRYLMTLVLGLGALLVACNGDESATPSPDPEATAGPAEAQSPTAEATERPSPTGRPQEAPPAPGPAFPLNVEVLGLGNMTLTIGPGDSQEFDPVQIAENQNVDVPPCAAFLVLLGWQVQDPYPADDVSLRFNMTRMGSTEEIGRGSVGRVKVGCGVIEVVNDGTVEVTVEARYGIGEIQG